LLLDVLVHTGLTRQTLNLSQEATAHREVSKNKTALRARANNWVEFVRSHPRSTGEIVVAGFVHQVLRLLLCSTEFVQSYCFGGSTTLEVARRYDNRSISLAVYKQHLTTLQLAARDFAAQHVSTVVWIPRTDRMQITLRYYTYTHTYANEAHHQNLPKTRTQCPVVVYHGQIDPFIKEESVAAFHKEMIDAKVDYQFISFGGAVHAFTVPVTIRAGAAEYHEPSDKRAWGYFVQFLNEVLPSQAIK